MNKKPIKPVLTSTRSVFQPVTLLVLAALLTTGVAIGAPEVNTPAPAETKENPKTAKAPVVIVLTLKKIVIDVAGKEKLEDAPKIKPGDLLEYAAVYRNRSREDILDLNASLPVPFGLEYLHNTAKPSAGALATLDNIKFESLPLKRKVTDKSGKTSEIEVPLAEYRGLRWTIGKLGAGKKAEVSARMRVIELAKPPEELVKNPGGAAAVSVQPTVKSPK